MAKWGLLKIVYDAQNKEVLRSQSDAMSKSEAVRESG